MACWQTVSFNQNGGSGGETRTLYFDTVSVGWYTSKSTSGTKITSVSAIPTKLGYTFQGYYATSSSYGEITIATSAGALRDGMMMISSEGSRTATAKWSLTCPCVAIAKNDGSGGTDLIYYDSENQKFYFDYPFATEFTSSSSIVIPTKTRYRFLGCYSTNSTSGTLLIDSDGTPTAAFFNLAPSGVTTIYAQWQEVSKLQTINSTYGTYQYKTFYQSLTADADGKYGYYSDDLCQTRIYGIPVPTRELYRWNGLASSSSSSSYMPTGTLYANATDGSFTSDFLNLAPAKRTVYGSFWTPISVKLTLSGSSWTIATTTYYLDKTNGGVYADWLLATPLSSLPIPVRAGYRFLGYYSGTSTSSPGTQYVDASGNILSALTALKAKTTINAIGRAASYTLTLNPNGGTTTEPTIYYDATSGEAAFFGANSAVKASVALPTYTGNSFLGYFTEEQGGTQVVGASGNILSSWVPTANATVYAHWGIDVSIIDVDPGDGSGGTTRFWHRSSTGKFYSDEALATEITSISVPSLRLHSLNGLYTDGGVLAVNASGVIQSTFSPTDEFVTLTATYARFAYEANLSSSGTGSLAAIYRAPGGSVWYSDLALTSAVTNVGVPTRTGYTFGGYDYGSTTVIDTSGNILSAAAVDEDYTASGVWTARTHTLTFDGNGATPSFASKTVTYGSSIGTLPTVTIAGRTFEAWQIDGEDVTAATVWNFDGAKTAVAKWKDFFGDPDDFFSLAGNCLMLVGSEDGRGRQVTNLWNGAYEQGGELLNPVCTYRVKASGNVTVTLGKAFAAGYMITGAEYRTGADQEPLFVVSGTANEGADAINQYAVAFAVNPDHIAQDPFAAVTGGGELVEMTSAAVCDAVVPYENNRPCASDVVHGRKRVTGRTAAYFGESAPTFLNSFIDSGTPASDSDVDYTTYAFTAERSI